MSQRIGWVGPLGDRGGYGNVARNYVRGLLECGVSVTTAPIGVEHPEIGTRERELLGGLARVRGDEDLVVVHADPGSLPGLIAHMRERYDGPIAACTIGETDRVPVEWARGCNLADEIWLPSTFNLLTFARSGVDLDRMRLVPYGMDPFGWDAEGPVAQAVAPKDHFVFLYAFAFDWRKGFDLLLAAYLNEFTRADATTLVVKVYDPTPRETSISARLAAAVAEHVDLFRQDLPRVAILDQPLAREELTALYRRANLYISTDRANGWGMPCMEAMTMGRPAACIDWSGSTEFMREDNALLIAPSVNLVPVDPRLQAERTVYRGQRWPEVAVADVAATMRGAVGERDALAALGARAREEIREHWSVAASGRWILERDGAQAYRSPAGLADRLRPLVGLAAEPPMREARENVLALAVDPWRSDWHDGLRAFADTFDNDDPVTLCLWAAPGADPAALTHAVTQTLTDAGHDADAGPDLLLTFADPEEALVEPRLRGIITPAALWPLRHRTVAPRPDALRAALDEPGALVSL